MKRKKKILACSLLTLLALFAYITLSGGFARQEQASLSNSDFIRLHVIANSDSDRDQAIKLQVRDSILEKLEEELTMEAFAAAQGGESGLVSLDKETYERCLADRLEEIEALAREVLRENGESYGAAAELTVCWIPEKSYEDITFPAGNYEALRVVLGEGGGENWWCVLFPPLCLIGLDDPATGAGADANDEAAAALKELAAAMDPKYDVLFTETGRPVELKLKFKTAELFTGR